MNPEIEQAAAALCAGSLTGDLEQDHKLLEVCAAGISYGQQHPSKQQQITDTSKLVSAVARIANLSCKDAAIALKIPKTIRKPVLKILAASARQKDSLDQGGAK